MGGIGSLVLTRNNGGPSVLKLLSETERQRAISEARKLPAPDAVLRLLLSTESNGRIPGREPILLECFMGIASLPELHQWQEKVFKLIHLESLTDLYLQSQLAWPFGPKWSYWRLRRKVPGFSDESYAAVLNRRAVWLNW
jgi:hypothetical protein